MKKHVKPILSFVLLSLVSCTKTPQASEDRETSLPSTTVSITTSTSISSTSISSKEENTFEELHCTFQNNVSEGFQYIGNEYSMTPSYYSEGYLKLNVEGTGILSPIFSSYSGRLRVAIHVAYLAKNIKPEAASEHVFTVTMLDSAKNIISERYVDTVKNAGNINLFIDGENVTQISIMMSGFPNIDGICYNLGISEITIKKA